MAQYPTPPARPLLDEVVRLLAAHRPAFGQERPHRRCVALALGWLVAPGRHTVTGVLVALGLGAADWSGFYRLFAAPRLDYDRLTRCLPREALPLLGAAEATPLLVAVDGVQVPRSSRTMPGTSWLKHPQTPPFKPGIHRAQRFVELDLLPALPAKAVPVPGYPPQRE